MRCLLSAQTTSPTGLSANFWLEALVCIKQMAVGDWAASFFNRLSKLSTSVGVTYC